MSLTRLTLRIESAGAAIHDGGERTLGEILRAVAWRIEQGTTEGGILDPNGNTVGSFSIEEEPDGYQ